MNGEPLLKEKDKTKKERSHSLSWWQKKADNKLQDTGRKKFKKCEVCLKPMYCLHHFFTKGLSSRLRYEWDNLIPICRSCHFAHHNKSDPRIHAVIIQKRGQEWYQNLERTKKEEVRLSVGYYKSIIETL